MYNKGRKDFLQHVPVCLDEFMSTWRPRTTGGLPHLTKMDQKPKPLGAKMRLLHVPLQNFSYMKRFNPWTSN